jgi:hypothetical protein
MMPAGMEVDAGPVPIGLEHGEPEGGFAGAEDPPDQSLPVLDAPKTVVVSPDIELVRWMMVRKQKDLRLRCPLYTRVSEQIRDERASTAQSRPEPETAQ